MESVELLLLGLYSFSKAEVVVTLAHGVDVYGLIHVDELELLHIYLLIYSKITSDPQRRDRTLITHQLLLTKAWQSHRGLHSLMILVEIKRFLFCVAKVFLVVLLGCFRLLCNCYDSADGLLLGHIDELSLLLISKL